MRLNDAIVALNDEQTALNVLTECQCYFDKIEEISGLFANGVVDNPTECRKILNECTAIYLALNPLLSLAETEKNNREVVHFNSRRMELEKNGGKFTATATEKESSAYVATYRRIRNILEGYVESVKVAIGTCQSNLKSMGEETRLTMPQQQG